MARYNIPVEGMRPGALPVGWDEIDDEDRPSPARVWDDDGEPRIIPLGGGLSISPAGLRRCACGAQVLLRTRADRAHAASCGKPADDDGEPGRD